MTNQLDIVRNYLALSLDHDQPVERALELVHSDFRFVERPNPTCPNGRTRDYDESLAGMRAGRQVMSSQRFDVIDLQQLADDEVVLRGNWTGVVAPGAPGLEAGQTIRTHSAMFIRIVDGRIARIEAYDCFEPFSLTAG